MEDNVKPIGKPTAWATPTAPVEPEAVKPAEPEEKPEPKKETTSAANGDTLAGKMRKKLTSVNVSLSGLPRAEVGNIVDEAGSTEGTESTEIRVCCYVEKGFASVGRLHQLMRCVTGALTGKCIVNEKTLTLTETDSREFSGPGMRYATLEFSARSVNRVD